MNLSLLIEGHEYYPLTRLSIIELLSNALTIQKSIETIHLAKIMAAKLMI